MQFKRIFILIGGLLSLGLISTDPGKPAADAILGTWLNEEKDAHILIYKEDNIYFGKLVWGKNVFEADGRASKKDTKNSDPSLRSRDLKDLVMVKDMRYSNQEWSGGSIYDPKSGDTYNCQIELVNNTLSIRGYIGFSLFGRTTVWTKVN